MQEEKTNISCNKMDDADYRSNRRRTYDKTSIFA